MVVFIILLHLKEICEVVIVYYIRNEQYNNGNYGNPMGQPFDDCVSLPDEFLQPYLDANGFVNITVEDGVVTNVEKNVEAWEAWHSSLQPEEKDYIPTAEQSTVVMMRSVFSSQASTMDDDQIIQCSGLAYDWQPGNHKQGEVYNANNQTWECYQAYNNDVYPGVNPDDPSWYTFNRPLHGKSPETARPFVTVQGAHDMYRSGEYMVFTDGLTYRCKSDTNFSPTDYPDAWEAYKE